MADDLHCTDTQLSTTPQQAPMVVFVTNMPRKGCAPQWLAVSRRLLPAVRDVRAGAGR